MKKIIYSVLVLSLSTGLVGATEVVKDEVEISPSSSYSTIPSSTDSWGPVELVSSRGSSVISVERRASWVEPEVIAHSPEGSVVDERAERQRIIETNPFLRRIGASKISSQIDLTEPYIRRHLDGIVGQFQTELTQKVYLPIDQMFSRLGQSCSVTHREVRLAQRKDLEDKYLEKTRAFLRGCLERDLQLQHQTFLSTYQTTLEAHLGYVVE